MKAADRNLMLLAFGSPDEPDANAALGILLEVIHSEASALADHDMTGPTAVRRLALACRLEALKDFVQECVTAKWTESEAAQ